MCLVALPEKQRVVREGNAQEGQAIQDPQQRAGLSLALFSALPAQLRLSSNRARAEKDGELLQRKEGSHTSTSVDNQDAGTGISIFRGHFGDTRMTRKV